MKKRIIKDKCEIIATELINNGVFGYFTIDFLVLIGRLEKNEPKIYYSGLKCYYDDFLAGKALYKTFVGEKYKERSFLYFPYLENFSFNKDLTYTKFFAGCKEENIRYDIAKKCGIVFIPYDLIEKGIMGIIVIGIFFF